MPPASSSASSSTLNNAPSLPPAASLPKRSVPIEDHNEPEPEVPWVAALTTYFGYALLFLFGYIPRGPAGYAPLADDYDDFYTRRLYHRIQDCWGRPISSAAGAWIDVMDRTSSDGNKTLQLTSTTRRCLNLGSYNYLGFAESEADVNERVQQSLLKYGAGCCSTRCDVGTTQVHLDLEKKVAEFVGKPAAVILGMGFATNSAIIPSLVGKGGLIISDALNHASIVVGARSSGANIKSFKHNDPAALEKVIRASIAEGQPRTHRPWKKILILVEGIYSMEGEVCRLQEIIDIKKKYKCFLYLDEAHSIGAMGATGRGICEHRNVNTADIDIMMGTFTKSFGSVGGYIASSLSVINYLKKTSPGLLYASAMAVPAATQAMAVIDILSGADGTTRGADKIAKLRRNTKLFREGLKMMGCEVIGDPLSPVCPMMLYNPAKMPGFSRECLARNLAVVVVGFPATSIIKSRTRFCVSAAHSEEDILDALQLIDDIADRVMLKYKHSGSFDRAALLKKLT